MPCHLTRLAIAIALSTTACQSGGGSNLVGPGPNPGPPPPPGVTIDAPVLTLAQAAQETPEHFRLLLDAREANILKNTTRTSTATLSGGTFVLRPDPNSDGSFLEGYCTPAPADLGSRPANGLARTKVGDVKRIGGVCESLAPPGGTEGCGLYIDIDRLNAAAFGGSNVGPFWICEPSCADGTKCNPLMDLTGTIACECRPTGG